jgi:hypothetical protein
LVGDPPVVAGVTVTRRRMVAKWFVTDMIDDNQLTFDRTGSVTVVPSWTPPPILYVWPCLRCFRDAEPV